MPVVVRLVAYAVGVDERPHQELLGLCPDHVRVHLALVLVEHRHGEVDLDAVDLYGALCRHAPPADVDEPLAGHAALCGDVVPREGAVDVHPVVDGGNDGPAGQGGGVLYGHLLYARAAAVGGDLFVEAVAEGHDVGVRRRLGKDVLPGLAPEDVCYRAALLVLYEHRPLVRHAERRGLVARVDERVKLRRLRLLRGASCGCQGGDGSCQRSHARKCSGPRHAGAPLAAVIKVAARAGARKGNKRPGPPHSPSV